MKFSLGRCRGICEIHGSFLFLIDRLRYPLAAVLHSPPTVDRALWGVATAVGKSFRVVLNVPEG
jgi:hypothetical protein